MQTVGNVGLTRARLFNSSGELIGYCLDTPNAIAKALMECPQAQVAQGILGINKREYYHNRMQTWNTAHSDLEVINGLH